MTFRKIRWLALSLVGAPTALGCSSGAINPHDSGTADGAGTQLALYAGTWDGHAEAWSFGADGSDRVRLTLDATGSGTMEVGEVPLPPPTDPNVGYPAGDPSDYINTLAEGYAYPTHSTRVEAGRVQFGVNTYDLFSRWCALQTPVVGSQAAAAPDAGSNSGYGCIPKFPPGTSSGAGPGNAADGGGQCIIAGSDGSILASIDCGKLFLCGQATACTCTEASCTSRAAPAELVPAQYSINVDGALEDPPTTLTATLAMNGTRVTVHLTRK